MYYESIADYDPLVFDIVQRYFELRRGKLGREDALRQIEEENSNELSDSDTAPVVRIGLAMALCQKKELTLPVREKASEAFCTLIRRGEWGEEGNAVLQRGMARIARDEMLGGEAVFKPKRIYIPDWKIGDTFSHVISDPLAADSGILGWCILLRKVGEMTDREGRVGQLVYISFCPPDRLPTSSEEINSLRYLIAQPSYRLYDNRHYYRFHLQFNSRKDEEAYFLERVGNFPDIRPPVDDVTEDKNFFHGISGSYLAKGTSIPQFERTIVAGHYRLVGLEPPHEQGNGSCERKG